MITKQHTALYFLALTAKRKEGDSYVKCYEELHEGLAWVLLPDAIRAYIGPRQAGHFEKLPNGTDTSWMKYPAPEVLKSLTKESAQSEIKFHLADGYPKCVIGEQTDVGLFDQKNWNHKFYHELRIHMLQDYMLDGILRNRMIHHENRFADQFALQHNPQIVLDGKQLRQKVAMFEEAGFLRLVKTVYENTGILLDSKWFEENVLTTLLEVYPEDLARNTFKYMVMSDEQNQRIQSLQFELTDEERNALIITDKLDDVLDELYADAYLYTADEL